MVKSGESTPRWTNHVGVSNNRRSESHIGDELQQIANKHGVTAEDVRMVFGFDS